MSFFGFHPIIAGWFQSRFEAPTEPQRLGWPSIAAGEHTLIAAPTGSGKTLTAFLACIDRLLKISVESELGEELRVVYVSPLRALSNDMHRNLEIPLAEITARAEAEGRPMPPIRVGLRTGDTSPSQRAALVRRPPHILVTTPESLYLMLTARKSRETLKSVETVIIDEIHALVRDKRGSHLALSLERLEDLCQKPLQRIGLSATQKPIERMAEFLVGNRPQVAGRRSEVGSRKSEVPNSELQTPNCKIINVGDGRKLDLMIEVPPSELGAVCMHEQWTEISARLVELINEHRSTLIFVNTRRLAERITHQLTELMGEETVGSHHGSLAVDIRLKTERRLKAGELKAVVATASLELGLDIGYIDLVVQIGSPRSIATLLQRIGRSGHSLGLVPKGRLFALTRDQLMECMALMRAVRGGRLDSVSIPEAPLDVLAQQIVAEVAAQEWGTDELFELFRRADPYRNLSRTQFDRVVEYLSEGITKSSGRSRVYLHHDQVQKRFRARKGARIAAVTNAGAIPEIASFRVVAEPEHTVVGTLDEDFAIESSGGDIFLLGNTSWRIQHIRGGDVTVTNAQGAPPTIPFWRGEAPGRTFELSQEVSRLREELDARISDCGLRISDCGVSVEDGPAVDSDSQTQNPKHQPPTSQIHNSQSAIVTWLVTETLCTPFAAQQIVEYAVAQKAAIGLLPTARRVVFERFFDETGGMQLVVHAPFGAAINRAWGLAFRKRFCRSFDFELQATADDDGFVLSLGPQHSFPIESLFPMLNLQNVRALLEQAVLTVPMFQVRWRWNVTRSLLVLRQQNGKKVPPAFQRFRADDLLSAVFPRLTGCQEEQVGDIELPDHPLVNQTMHDCLHEALDFDGLQNVLSSIERGELTLIARDTREPSPFSDELLNANVYAFLDGGEIQERRARAVSTRRSFTVESVRDLGRLDPEAIEQVRREAQPLVRSADELHDTLLSRIVLPIAEPMAEPMADVTDWEPWYRELAGQNRAATLTLPNGRKVWVTAERLPAALAVFPDAVLQPMISAPQSVRHDWTSTEARIAMVRGLIEICGPVTSEDIADRLSFTGPQTSAALEALEGEGVVLRGQFTPQINNDLPSPSEEPVSKSEIRNPKSEIEWCHRRLLARIHRLTLQGLRRQIAPVGVDVFMRYLTRHHGLLASERRTGTNGVFEVVAMLQGLDFPAVSWERDILPARLDNYRPQFLDELCLTGEVGWGRLFPPKKNPDRSKPMASLTRVAPVSLVLRSDLAWLSASRPRFQPDNNPKLDDEPRRRPNTSSPPSEGGARGGRTQVCEDSPPVSEQLLSSPAREVFDLLSRHGAMFAADLMEETSMLPSQLDDVLGELVVRGLVTADGFSGLRKLIAEKSTSSHRKPLRTRSGVLRNRKSAGASGRWSVWQVPSAGEDETEQDDFVQQWAWQLLRRWGVVFRDLLIREAGAPRWFELLQVYRRLEARGEIRGGCFIAGVAGEQFALGDTVRQLRKLREDGPQQEFVVLCASDPLNLIGILTDHPRVPRTASNRVAYLDGVPLASLQAGDVGFYKDVPVELQRVLAERFGLSGSAMPRHAASALKMVLTDLQ